jgi:hypothetical protein
MQNANINELQNDLEIQLMSEREQHTNTKHLLQLEQQKVRNLNAKLDQARIEASTFTAAHRLNAAALSKAIHSIEPKIDQLIKKANLLTTDDSVNSDNLSNVDIRSGELPDGPSCGFETSHLPEQVPWLPAVDMSTKRPSALYGILEDLPKGGHDGVPDLLGPTQEHADELADSKLICGLDDQVGDKEDIHGSRQQVNEWVGLSPPADLLGDIGEFLSLDEVLESESAPRRVKIHG